MTVDFLSVQWRHAKFLCALSSVFFSAASFSAERLPESLAADSSVAPFAEISVESADSADQVYLEADQMPSFPGGVKAMMSYIQKNVVYPKQALEDSIQGRSVVTFTVDKDGSVSDARITIPAHPQLDAEAMRVISNMPKWEPGMRNGKPVRVQYSVPVAFRLNPSKAKAKSMPK